MASFNDPKLSNHIADDVPAIRQLLRSVAALDPATGNTDIPSGAKRLVETEQGYEFQSYNGTAWVALEKWNLDVQKVDGHTASTDTTASTIPVRDADGRLPGDILGNAATASKAAALSAANPVNMGGTGGTTAAQARTNLGVPPTDHASSGTDYGIGTGSNYGHVKLSDSTSSTSAASEGIAASPKAVKDAYDKAVAAYLPVGSIIAFAGNPDSDPSGYLLCNGAPVNRTTYATLFAVIGGTYGVGDGSTTFNLPDLTDKFIQGRATAGGVIEAGLPNITGWVTTALNSGGGAFLLKATHASYSLDDGAAVSFGWHVFDFNANRSNGVYGKAYTVQPPAVTMRYYIKY